MLNWIALFLLLAARVAGAEGEGRFLSNTRQITFEGKSGEGYFSPDGRKLVFQSVREPGNPFYQIYMLDFETGGIHRVSPGIGKTTCSFFRPNSDEVIFASSHHDPNARKKQEDEIAFLASGKTRRYSWDYDPEMEIFSARHDGSNLRRLTDSPGYDAEGACSPDGRRIVFTSIRDAFPLDKLSPDQRKRYENDPAWFAEIYIMNADGSGQKRLTESPGYDGGPFFTPDGQRIIWRRFDENGLIADVYSMNLDGSDARRLTRFESMSWAPYPHPSGRYLVFTSNKHGFENFELFIVDSDGRHEPVRVTFTGGFDGLPVFSPDGKKLCWTSNRGGGQSQLFLADWNDAEALRALEVPSLSPEIRAEDARAHVTFLASDALEGRKTGEKGARMAAEYIASQLKSIGAQPLDPSAANPYFQPFEFTAGVEINRAETALMVESPAGTAEFKADEQFRPLAFSSNGTFEGPVVFAGYGLSVPGKPGEGYDSYEGLDVTNKVVLVLRYVPEAVSPDRGQELSRYAALRYKAMIARERGARAILIVTGPNSPNAGELVRLASDGSLSGSEILAASISIEAAEQILKSSGKNLKALQTALDSENPHAERGFEVSNTTVRLKVTLERRLKTDQNVIAVMRGAREEYVLVGAHYDHLGRGDSPDSRSAKDEQGQIHNGADDNASGVAAVLELAGCFATNRLLPGRGIICAFWSGEEMGLLGSSRFAENPPLALSNIAACLNFDMVGRLRDNKLVLQGAGSSSIWRKLIERRNIAAGFNLVVQDDPYLPTDTTAFYPKGVPVLSFFTSSHDDYHRPTDDAEKLNSAGIERIAKFARLLIQDLLAAPDRPDFVKVERSNAGGARDALRVYLGTVPDYAAEVKGVKLSGVRGGSPAEKGGVQAGDIIIEFAGRKIANIYDYTYALDAARIGQPLKIKVLRENQPVELTVIPEARK